ncbi:GatB/YqeY domain-containing protein [Fulvivirga ligni]|uniref:GatB/YqeY domain-containing protein n=1 Tax=Fulvivirga ligni TaxID=2904246 RepID=UPI001F430436|nr:GatB/YqeY domain-containing protein [Fulvivirga ligni]UII22752.1 GatB/YqeY domain-containing protein [Fulvivirga ligni]
MSLKQQIDQDIKSAMLAKKKEELTALRAIKSAILLAETEKGGGEGLNEDAEIKLLTKAAKQRKESAELYDKEGRADLADKEKFEYEVISRYLPAQLSEEELKAEIEAIISQVGAAGPQDMGKVMGVASKQLAGKADGKMIASVVKDSLNK